MQSIEAPRKCSKPSTNFGNGELLAYPSRSRDQLPAEPEGAGVALTPETLALIDRREFGGLIRRQFRRLLCIASGCDTPPTPAQPDHPPAVESVTTSASPDPSASPDETVPTQAGGPSASAAFEKPFLDATAANYGAPLEPRDFKNAPAQQRAFINGWVKKQTRDRIVDLIPPPGIDAETRLVLVNALYLKAAWAALEKKLNASTLASWLGKMKHERVWLTLPKFTIDPAKTIDLADTLKAMGMPLAFTAAKADFTGISNPPNPNRRLCRVCLLNIRRC